MVDSGASEKSYAYVLVTPFHNEGALIEGTIQSMLAQTVKPSAWILVDDASGDAGPQIVKDYAKQHPFIKLVRIERSSERSFGHKALAFERGLSEVKQIHYDFIGNLDADITAAPDYFEQVIEQLGQNPKLGVAGGLVASCHKGNYVRQHVAVDSVAGAVQMFRRECFTSIGGYKSLPLGGIDSAAEVEARMKGWQVRTFPHLVVLEHRWTGSATAGGLKAALRKGRKFYSLGYSPLFFSLKCARDLFEKPMFLGSILAFASYLYMLVRRAPLALAPDVVSYLRTEQRTKLKQMLGLG